MPKETIDTKISELAGKETFFQEDTEVGQAFKNLDSEEALNKNTRLRDEEIRGLLSLEGLQDMGILDKNIITINKSFKELSISKDGKGREEKVRIFAEERKNKAGGGFFERMGGMFKKREV